MKRPSSLAVDPESTPAGRLPLPFLVLWPGSVEHYRLLAIAESIGVLLTLEEVRCPLAHSRMDICLDWVSGLTIRIRGSGFTLDALI